LRGLQRVAVEPAAHDLDLDHPVRADLGLVPLGLVDLALVALALALVEQAQRVDFLLLALALAALAIAGLGELDRRPRGLGALGLALGLLGALDRPLVHVEPALLVVDRLVAVLGLA